MAKVNPIQVQKYLSGVDYPLSKEDIVQAAQREGADDEVQATLARLPDRSYGSPAEVSKAIGELE